MKTITIERRIVTRQYEHVMISCIFDRLDNEDVGTFVKRANHQTHVALMEVYKTAMEMKP